MYERQVLFSFSSNGNTSNDRDGNDVPGPNFDSLGNNANTIEVKTKVMSYEIKSKKRRMPFNDT
jgi:hypothetical protein